MDPIKGSILSLCGAFCRVRSPSVLADEIGLHLQSDVPRTGKGAGLGLPFSGTETMSMHMAEIALDVAPCAHAEVLMDQAG